MSKKQLDIFGKASKLLDNNRIHSIFQVYSKLGYSATIIKKGTLAEPKLVLMSKKSQLEVGGSEHETSHREYV